MPDSAALSQHRTNRYLPAAVAAGGALGALLRHGASLLASADAFPWATLAVNAAGCLAVGIVAALTSEIMTPHPLLRPFLVGGVLGGFTTFSTYVIDTTGLWLDGRSAAALLYPVVTVVLALGAVQAGLSVTRWAAGRFRRQHAPVDIRSGRDER